jgi:hypothetical protein
MSFILKTLKVLLIGTIAYLTVFLAETRTDGFRTSKVMFDLNFDPSFEIETITDKDLSKAQEIFRQNFIYLGRGRQYFVFESVDGKYVIKLLNHNNFSYPSILKRLSFIKPIDKIVKRKDHKYPLTFSSMKLSFENLKREAKLIYINLNKDIKLHKSIKISNKCGSSFIIDLDKTIFILQKKVSPFFTSLEKIYETEKEAGIQLALDEYLKFVTNRCVNNIADDDPTIQDNMGFKNHIPVLIDTGRLYVNEHLKEKYCMTEEMLKSTKFLRKWLSIKHPEQVSFLDHKIEYYLNNYSN